MRTLSARLAPLLALLLSSSCAFAGPGTADVVGVKATGQSGHYDFSVTIHSPDLGCNQYADWWEVLDESGHLLYRRILFHSHADEQPFERSGGPVPIEADRMVWVRAHMHPGGYGGKVYKGSVRTGFQAVAVAPGFARNLEQAQPLPDGCAF